MKVPNPTSKGNDVTNKSCMACPSRLAVEEAGKFFGRDTGMPMCARFGNVLGRPGLNAGAERLLAEKTAKECDEHGKERPIGPPEYLNTLVASPNPTVLAKGMPDNSERGLVKSCLDCENYIMPAKVRREFGWTTGLCGATGRLLIDDQTNLRKEAKNCSWAREGFSTSDTNGMVVLPMFAEAFEYDPDPVKAFLARKGKPVVDPQDYPTDAEVTDDDREYGVRAWRRIQNPDGSGRYVDLPIFDHAKFPAEEQRLIPQTGDREHPEWYVDVNGYVYKMAVSMMATDWTPCLSGPPGVGKTELARHFAWLCGLPFARISLNERSEVEDLIGHMEYDHSEGTHFVYGRVVKRWARRGVLLLDEPNTSPDAVWQRIRPMTDNAKQLALDENSGEIIDRDEFCFLILAMNPSYDARNIGTKELAAADRDRLHHHYVDLPPVEVEREIIRQRVNSDDEAVKLPDADLDKLLEVATELREMVQQDFPITWGIRPNIKVAELLRWFEPLDAYKVAVANDLERETADIILDRVRAKWAVS